MQQHIDRFLGLASHFAESLHVLDGEFVRRPPVLLGSARSWFQQIHGGMVGLEQLSLRWNFVDLLRTIRALAQVVLAYPVT